MASTNAGGTEALLPVLQLLRASRWELNIFALAGTPADRLYRAHGFEPKTFETYGYKRLDDIQAMRVILAEVNPSLVLTSIASENTAIDRIVLDAAQREGIPNAALCETWPHVWLGRLVTRDGPVYRKADALLVCDKLAYDAALSHGFDPDRVRICGSTLDDELSGHKSRLSQMRWQARRELNFSEDALVIAWFGTYDLDDEEHRGPAYEGRYGFSEAEAVREYLGAMRDAIPRAQSFGRTVRGLHRQKPDFGRVKLLEIERELEFHVTRDTRAAGGNISTIAACDVICSLVGGISLTKAAKLGVPGVFYQPGATPETNDDPLCGLGVTTALYERGALREFILELAERPSKLHALKDGPTKIGLEPGASQRVVRELERLAV